MIMMWHPQSELHLMLWGPRRRFAVSGCREGFSLAMSMAGVIASIAVTPLSWYLH
jgi:hypothetical protein